MENKKLRGILVCLLFFLSKYIQKFYSYLLKIDINKITANQAIYLSLYATLTILLIYILIYKEDIKKDMKKFKNNLWESLNNGLGAWFMGFVFMFMANTFITSFFSITSGNENIVRAMIKINPSIMLLYAGILAPINEELVFRKAIRDIMGDKYKVLFIIISGLIFGYLHVTNLDVNIYNILFIIPYGILGMALAYTYRETDSIITPILIHMFHNIAVTLFVIFLV